MGRPASRRAARARALPPSGASRDASRSNTTKVMHLPVQGPHSYPSRSTRRHFMTDVPYRLFCGVLMVYNGGALSSQTIHLAGSLDMADHQELSGPFGRYCIL